MITGDKDYKAGTFMGQRLFGRLVSIPIIQLRFENSGKLSF